MYMDNDGRKVRYDFGGGEGTPLLLLHGWGCDASSMRHVFDYFVRRGRTVIAPDLEGFGASDPPPPTYTVYDYARSVFRLVRLTGASEADVIAHSFGARIALVLAGEKHVRRLLITGGAGMKPRRGPRYAARVASFKLRRRLGLNTSGSGSADYRALGEDMKRVFVSVVNTHLDGLLPAVDCPTLLVWGRDDRVTPLYMARRMKRGIRGSALVTIDGGHFAYAADPARFVGIADAFFGEE